jgi:hypothetical protein
MPGLSQYQFAGLSPDVRDAQNPRNPALASNTMSERDSAGLDQMLQNIDTGAAAPSNMGESRATLPQPAAQDQNPWLQWLMQYLQTKGQPMPGQGAPR